MTAESNVYAFAPSSRPLGDSTRMLSSRSSSIWILFIAVPSPAFLLDGSSFVSERHDLRDFVEQHSTLPFPKPSD